MDRARIDTTSTLVTAMAFSLLPPRRQALWRPRLTCPTCGRPAFFMRQKRTGASSCFGARPHAFGCVEASAPRSPASDIPPVHDDGSLWIFEVAYSGAMRGPTVEPRARATYSRNEAPSRKQVARQQKSIADLLKDLIRRPEIRESKQRIAFAGVSGTVAGLCVDLTDRSRLELGVSRLYWGTLRDVRPGPVGKAGYWLNVANDGYSDSVVVWLPDSLMPRVLHTVRAQSVDQLEQATFITVGALHAGPSGRPNLRITTLDDFAIRDANRDAAYI